MSFYTGGGDGKKARLALNFSSELWGECEQHLLEDCPDVRSSHLLVEGLQRPRIHWPGELPYYIKDLTKAKVICPESNRIYADRIDENVPIFSDTIFFDGVAKALPAAPAEEEPVAPSPASADAVVPAADQGGEAVAVPPPPAPHPESLSREDRLRLEATSPEHLMTHFPKNPYCQWCQRGRMCSARVRRKPADADIVPDKEPPTAFGQEMSTDTYIVSKDASDERRTAGGGEYCVQTNRDVFSGIFAAYPLSSKAHEYLMVTMQHFNDKPPGEGVVMKGDNAPEAIKAFRKLGWRHDPSLENRFPHNAAHERDTRTWAELLRTNFLSSGLHIFPKTWALAAEYAAVAFSVSAHPPILPGEEGTEAAAAKLNTNRWALATGGNFRGRPLALGQLVYSRVVSNDNLSANAVAGIFAGWKIEAGFRYRNMTKVLSYAALKDQTGDFGAQSTCTRQSSLCPREPPSSLCVGSLRPPLRIFQNPTDRSSRMRVSSPSLG